MMKPSHMGVKGGYLTRFSDSRIIRLLKVHDPIMTLRTLLLENALMAFMSILLGHLNLTVSLDCLLIIP